MIDVDFLVVAMNERFIVGFDIFSLSFFLCDVMNGANCVRVKENDFCKKNIFWLDTSSLCIASVCS
jgi:hypothetical protein